MTFDLTPGRASITGLSAIERASDPGRSLLDVTREADRIVLAKYAPAGVVVNDLLQIVQFRGQTGMYLEPAPGTPNFNLLQMARDGLLVALREALEAARRDGVPQHCDRVFIRSNGELHEIALEVLPLLIPAANKRFFVVLFSRSNTAPQREQGSPESRPQREQGSPESRPQRQRGRSLPDAPDSESLGSSESLAASALAHAAGDLTEADLKARDDEFARLRHELDATKSYLQSVIEVQEAGNEELTAANEEIISSNEELQSTNEELETAKEELQATNEELTTVNEELQCRIAISVQLSDDLTNLMDAVNIPTVLLDRALLIRRFSPSAQNLFRLISSDIGRPIGDFKLKINVPDLEPMLQQVIDSLEMQQREVQDTDGRWHRLVVRPYKTTDNKIDGAIIKLSDIDALKRREHDLEVSRDYAVSIVATCMQPLVVLDAELRVQLANRAFYESFQVTREETEQRLIYSLGNSQWDIPRLRVLLEEILPQNTSFDGFELEHNFPTIGHRTMLLNARCVRFPEGRPTHILLGINDVTEIRAAAAVIAVAAVNQKTLERQLIEREVLNSVSQEQRRIGQDLHDGLGQELTGLGFLAASLADSLAERSLQGSEALVGQAARPLVSSEESSRRAAGSPENSPSPEAAFLAHAAAYTATAKKLVEGLDRALKQVREVSKGLIPVELSAEGLQLALEDLAANITAQTHVTCRFTGSAEIDDSPRATNLFRIAQEATTNAIKHSHANLITLSLNDEDEGHITLSICDNGIGFPDLATATSGLGLKTMRYRASLIGATLTIDTAHDRGTRIICTLDKGLPK